MEENEKEVKKPIMFGMPITAKPEKKISLENTVKKTAVKKSGKSIRQLIDYDNPKYKKIDLANNCKLVLVDSPLIDGYSITVHPEIVRLDVEHPELIVGFIPPLFNAYTTALNAINPFVKLRQKVQVLPKYRDHLGSIERTVINYRFVGLSDMTVIVVTLDDNSTHLAHTLSVVK